MNALVAHTALATLVLVSAVWGHAIAGPGRQSYAELDGWKVAYESTGTGSQAVVFIHGANSSRGAWHKQMSGLDTGRLVIAIDLLGAGDSDKPDTAYSMDLFARAVAAVMDAEGVSCATLVGHSNGVSVARQFYRLFPQRVEAIVAVDGAFRNTLSPEMVQWMRAAFDRPDFDEFSAGLLDMMPKFSLTEADIALITRHAQETPKHVMVGSFEAITDPDIWEEDPVNVPLLVLLAQQPTWTPEYIEFVQDIGPEVEYHMWEGVSHFMQLERPDDFNQLVEEFVGRLPGC